MTAVAAPLDPNSSVPTFIREWIPTAWMNEKPATIEAVWAGLNSLVKIGSIAVAMFEGAATTIGISATDIPAQLTFALHYNWMPLIVTAAITYFKTRRAFVRAKAAS